MRKLSKIQVKQKDALVSDVVDAVSEVETAIDEYNSARLDAWGTFEALMNEAHDEDDPDKHNKLVGAAEKAVADFNDKEADTLTTDIEEALDRLREKLEPLVDFRDDIVAQMRDYFEGRSERWQESDAGGEYEGWIEAWEYAELEPAELDDPKPLEGTADSAHDTLDWDSTLGHEDLPDSPQG